MQASESQIGNDVGQASQSCKKKFKQMYENLLEECRISTNFF